MKHSNLDKGKHDLAEIRIMASKLNKYGF
uniref:Uncharacterized protein n=1 Tax=Arundo donax TaxID=35708 RepID=A0A0A8YF81_ARUDO